MSLVGYALRMAKQYYKPDTYEHAIRVAGYVADNNMIPDEDMDICISLAIMHDLAEDTNYREFNDIPYLLQNGMEAITKKKDESYIKYIKNIANNRDNVPEAYWVKLADMKDHLMQTETLTDKLKEKYLVALPYLL